MPPPPLAVGHVDAAVGAEQELVGVLRVDPQRVVVAVRPGAEAVEADRGVERLAAVRAHRQRQARLVDRVEVGGIDDDAGEVERPHLQVEGVVDLPPVLPRVVRAEEGGVLGLDQGVDHVRPRRRDRHGDAPLLPRGQPCFERLPGLAAVARLVEAAPLAAGREGVRRAAELPHAGVEDRRVLGIDREIGAAGVGVDVEHLLPGLAAVRRLVDAAVRVAVPEMAGGAGPDGVAVGRAHLDAGDALGVLEADPLPGVAAVGGLVEAVPDRGAVAGPRLAGAHPDLLRVLGIDGDGADRLVVVVEDRLEDEAAVGRLPDAAAGRSDIDRERILAYGVDRRDAAAHAGRTEGAGLDAAEGIGIDLGVRPPAPRRRRPAGRQAARQRVE